MQREAREVEKDSDTERDLQVRQSSNRGRQFGHVHHIRWTGIAQKQFAGSDFRIFRRFIADETNREILKEKKNVIFIKNFNNVYAWKNEIQKIKFLNDKRFIISQNNFKLSKNYKLKERAQRILDSLNYNFERN